MGVLALSINEIADASNQPLVPAMLIAFVISEPRCKFNSILWKSMVRRHIMLEFWMFLDLSIISGKFELPGRLYLLNQQAEQPFIMEPKWVIVIILKLMMSSISLIRWLMSAIL